APEKKKRVKARASARVNGRDFSFCSRRDHSERGYAKRQRSRPRVTTKEAPNPSLNLEGMNRRPLSSRECRYSPMNIPPSPLPPTFPHFPPHCKLYHMHSKKSCIAETTKSGAASCDAPIASNKKRLPTNVGSPALKRNSGSGRKGAAPRFRSSSWPDTPPAP